MFEPKYFMKTSLGSIYIDLTAMEAANIVFLRRMGLGETCYPIKTIHRMRRRPVQFNGAVSIRLLK
jgi:hypothetical protein